MSKLHGKLNRRKRGLTLIELLIIVIILGILAAIVVPQFSCAEPILGNDSSNKVATIGQGNDVPDNLQADDDFLNSLDMRVIGAATERRQMSVPVQGPAETIIPLNRIESASIWTDETN